MRQFMKATVVLLVLGTVTAQAQPGTGPVATACESDIARLCAGKSHQNRAIRACLEAGLATVSDECRAALNATGRGRGRAGRNAPN